MFTCTDKGQYSTIRPRQTCTDNGNHIRSPLPNWSPAISPVKDFHGQQAVLWISRPVDISQWRQWTCIAGAIEWISVCMQTWLVFAQTVTNTNHNQELSTDWTLLQYTYHQVSYDIYNMENYLYGFMTGIIRVICTSKFIYDTKVGSKI